MHREQKSQKINPNVKRRLVFFVSINYLLLPIGASLYDDVRRVISRHPIGVRFQTVAKCLRALAKDEGIDML